MCVLEEFLLTDKGSRFRDLIKFAGKWMNRTPLMLKQNLESEQKKSSELEDSFREFSKDSESLKLEHSSLQKQISVMF